MTKEELREKRLSLGMSQLKYAQAIGMSEITVRRSEIGLSKVSKLLALKAQSLEVITECGGLENITLDKAKELIKSLTHG